MLASAWRDRPTLRGLVDRVIDSCRKGKVDTLVIENRAGAEWVRQEIMQLMRAGEWSIVLDEPRGDKVARLHSVTPLSRAA
jgi:phage terminase large subunit-like protein